MTKNINLLIVDMINNLIQNENMSFRDAYLKISNSIKEGKFDNIKTNKQTLIGSIHNLCLEKIQNKNEQFLLKISLLIKNKF